MPRRFQLVGLSVPQPYLSRTCGREQSPPAIHERQAPNVVGVAMNHPDGDMTYRVPESDCAIGSRDRERASTWTKGDWADDRRTRQRRTERLVVSHVP